MNAQRSLPLASPVRTCNSCGPTIKQRSRALITTGLLFNFVHERLIDILPKMPRRMNKPGCSVWKASGLKCRFSSSTFPGKISRSMRGKTHEPPNTPMLSESELMPAKYSPRYFASCDATNFSNVGKRGRKFHKLWDAVGEVILL